MQRYFGKLDEGKIILSKDDIFHIGKVMRFHIDDEIEVICDGHLFLCSIASFSPFEVRLVKEILENHELNNKVTLFFAPPKGDKLDLVIQKATEIGVNEIVIVLTSRTVIKVKDEEKEKKLIRLQRIAKEASEQSKRSIVPKIDTIISFGELKDYAKSSHLFILDTNPNYLAYSFYEELGKINKTDSVSLFVGPEGGFALEEVKFANEIGFQSVSLGRRILRSETAAIVGLGIVAFMLEKL